MKCLTYLLCVGTLLFGPTVFADVIDTIRIAEAYGHMASGDDFVVRLYLSNPDDTVNGISIPLVFTSSGGPIVPDSLVKAGRSLEGGNNYLFFGIPKRNLTPLAPTDSAVLVVAGDPDFSFLPGSGVLCDLWFSGGHAGDQIEFQFVDALVWPTLAYTLHAAKPRGEGNIPLVGVNSIVTLLPPGQPVISCPVVLTGFVFTQMDIPVVADANGMAVSMQIVSFTGPNGPVALPSVSGTNPWTVSWIPPMGGVGTYVLSLRFLSQAGIVVDRTVTIQIGSIMLPGDMDCNGRVDLTDLSRLISFIITRNPLPICP